MAWKVLQMFVVSVCGSHRERKCMSRRLQYFDNQKHMEPKNAQLRSVLSKGAYKGSSWEVLAAVHPYAP